MKSFLSYKDAAVYTDEVITSLLQADERRRNYGEIFMQQLRAEQGAPVLKKH